MATPNWQAAANGTPGTSDAVNASTQINQLLNTHRVTPIYRGEPQILPGTTPITAFDGAFFWIDAGKVTTGGLLHYDWDVPITMPSGVTTIGRVELAMQPIGGGADTVVTLYPDSGGVPNTGSPIVSTIIPAKALTTIAATNGLASPPNALATASNNTMQVGIEVSQTWATAPALNANGSPQDPAVAQYGDYVMALGGFDFTGNVVSPLVYTMQYLGDGVITGPTPQPSLPAGTYFGAAGITPTNVVYAGGTTTTTASANVWSASWTPGTGVVGSWTQQASLPVGLMQSGCATWEETVYIIGGSTTNLASNAVPTVYYATVTNGQITSWQTATPLPQAIQCMFCAAINGYLIVAGGQSTSDSTLNLTYFAPINADGSLGGWSTGPVMLEPVYALTPGFNRAFTDSALVIPSGLVSGGVNIPVVQILTVGKNGPAPAWQIQQEFTSGTFIAGASSAGTGSPWTLVRYRGSFYTNTAIFYVPMISIPLPATGLTPGNAYHILIHQIGGDINNYVQVGEITSDPSGKWLYTPRGSSSGPWTTRPNFSILANVYDLTTNGPLMHTWEDGGRRTTTLVRATTPDQRLLGVLSMTTLPDGVTTWAEASAITYDPTTGLPTAANAL